MGPANPHVRKLFRMVRPTDEGRGLAPTSATERGANKRSRRYVLIESVVRLAPCGGRSRPFAQATSFRQCMLNLRPCANHVAGSTDTTRKVCDSSWSRSVTYSPGAKTCVPKRYPA